MKKIIVLSFVFVLFTSISCKKDKYIPPQDEAGKLCIQQIDGIRKDCVKKAQRDYRFCVDNKRKKCKLNFKPCNDQYKKGYIGCGGQVVKE